jgi:hypothetical protein
MSNKNPDFAKNETIKSGCLIPELTTKGCELSVAMFSGKG